MQDQKRWDMRYHERQTLDLFWSKSSNRAPEVVGQEISYAFLGMKLECAQCHKHPFDKWTQDDFWGFTAFFTRIMFNAPRDVQVPGKPRGNAIAPFSHLRDWRCHPFSSHPTASRLTVVVCET